MSEKLQSIFASGNQAAICLFEIEDKTARLVSTWKSSPDDADVISAAIQYGQDSRFIVNPDPKSEKSFLRPILQRHDFEEIKVSKPIQPIEGRLIINELLRNTQLKVDEFEGWPRLQKLLNRADENPVSEAMAMFQGVVEAQKLTNRVESPFLCSFDEEDLRRRREHGRLYGVL